VAEEGLGRPAGGPGAEFRRAGPRDVDALVDLRIDFMRIVKDGGLPDEEAWRAELAGLFARDLASGALLAWVAEEEGRVVASCGLALGRPDAAEGEGEILSVYTAGAYRRRGIGAALLRLALGEARARGLRRLRLQPTDDGRPLYERAGFRDEGRDMVLVLEAGRAEEKP